MEMRMLRWQTEYVVVGFSSDLWYPSSLPEMSLWSFVGRFMCEEQHAAWEKHANENIKQNTTAYKWRWEWLGGYVEVTSKDKLYAWC